jgi:hypothetical protein
MIHAINKHRIKHRILDHVSDLPIYTYNQQEVEDNQRFAPLMLQLLNEASLYALTYAHA